MATRSITSERREYANVVGVQVPRVQERIFELGAFVAPAMRRTYRGDATRVRQNPVDLVGSAITFTGRASISVGGRAAVNPPADGAPDSPRDRGNRHWHRAGKLRQNVPEFHSGRQILDAPLWRHRAGPRDQRGTVAAQGPARVHRRFDDDAINRRVLTGHLNSLSTREGKA